MTVERLFIYGTLGPGGPNQHVMDDIGGSWSAATVKGRLRDKGWGAAMGYPGLVLDAEDEPVPGFVFSSENLAAYWDELDRFEGEAYRRVVTTVMLEDGSTVATQIYALDR